MLLVENVLLVVNPISGDLDKSELISVVEEKVMDMGKFLTTYPTTGKEDKISISRLLDELQPYRVLVAGGDGTIALVAELLRGREEAMGLLPAGSANGLATDFGIPADLHQAIDVALGDSILCIDGLDINGKISLHLSDIGLNALLIKNYEAGDIRGKLGYAKEVLKTLSEYEVFTVKISYEDTVIDSEAVIVILANAKKYGTGVTINPGGDMSDGRFEVVIARKFDVIEIARLLAGNTEFNPEIVTLLSVKACEIECTNGEAHFQVDGEYMGMVSKIKAQSIPQMVWVAVPA